MLESELNVGIKKLITNKDNLSDMDDKADRMKCKFKFILSLCQ